MALAVACSQPGREWSPADFHQALIYTQTRGGWWARKLRERKGTEYAEHKLTCMLDKARAFIARSGVVTSADRPGMILELIVLDRGSLVSSASPSYQGHRYDGGDHRALRAAVLPVPAQLPRGRGADARARRHRVL